MITRKPSLFSAAYSSFTSFPTNINASSTSLKRKRESTRPCPYCNTTYRKYATIAEDTPNTNNSHDDQQPHQHAWPSPPSGQTTPTPYQIFAIPPNATYTKSRFYQLVKLYHPDRDSHATPDNVSKAIKMERYRLIVAANDILSDPTKRRAYDRFGAGWNGKPGHRRPNDPAGPFSQNWTGSGENPQDPIWRNATWEDWERFYHARAKAEGQGEGEREGVHHPHRTGLYLSNSYFLLVVMVLALMGSTANFSRAQNEGHYLIDQRDIIHDRTAKELRKVKREALTSGSKEGRVQWFVRNRDATMGNPGADPETLREERADRVLPEREVCRADGRVEGEGG